MTPAEIARAEALLFETLRIRRFEEKCAELYGQEKTRGFLHLYVGEEAVAAGVCAALAGPRTRGSPPTGSTTTRSE